MPSIGYLQVRAFVSSARIPLANVAVSVQTPQGTLLAARLTNRSGMLDTPIPIEVPNRSAGLTPDTGVVPFTQVNLFARKKAYEQIESENVQIFPGVITTQNLPMIPLAEFPDAYDKSEIFNNFKSLLCNFRRF